MNLLFNFTLSSLIQILFIVFFTIHLFYFLIALCIHPKQFAQKTVQSSFDFLIVAKNEETVIGDLIDSIYRQNYDLSKIRVFVFADNCTDQTYAVAKKHDAIVFKNDTENHIGKGIALKKLIDLRNGYDQNHSDAVAFFDADNILHPDFTQKMNEALINDREILTGYRNAKNFSSSMSSSGSSILFLREAHFLHPSRNALGLSTHLNGTGFVLRNDVVINEPWDAFSLIEDIEFTILQLIKNRKVIFVHEAIFYDEQPADLSVSMKQRMRWIKGGIQIFYLHSVKLIRSMFKKWSFAKFDLWLWTVPFPSLLMILSMIELFINQYTLLMSTDRFSLLLLTPTFIFLLNFMFFAFMIGMTTVIAAWRYIHASTKEKLWAMMTFPFFSLTFIPILILAPFRMRHLKWYKTPHSVRWAKETK
jgi:cellulose synthase/poly-beta-1,6-N-acetylglucosamine synthase-like glycosyltransferase